MAVTTLTAARGPRRRPPDGTRPRRHHHLPRPLGRGQDHPRRHRPRGRRQPGHRLPRCSRAARTPSSGRRRRRARPRSSSGLGRRLGRRGAGGASLVAALTTPPAPCCVARRAAAPPRPRARARRSRTSPSASSTASSPPPSRLAGPLLTRTSTTSGAAGRRVARPARRCPTLLVPSEHVDLGDRGGRPPLRPHVPPARPPQRRVPWLTTCPAPTQEIIGRAERRRPRRDPRHHQHRRRRRGMRHPADSYDAIFTWDYDQGRPPEAATSLYEKAKTVQWNGETDLPWEIDVDQEEVVAANAAANQRHRRRAST